MSATPSPGPRPAGAIPTPAQAMPAAVDPEALLTRLEHQEVPEQIETLEKLLGQLTRDLSQAQG